MICYNNKIYDTKQLYIKYFFNIGSSFHNPPHPLKHPLRLFFIQAHLLRHILY